jgi:hypothetical protein
MRRQACIVGLVSLCVLGATGCGGGTHADSAPSTSAARTTDQPATPVVLEDAVRKAVNENHELLTQALLTNRVPANPQGTAGPALAVLRSSAAARRVQKIKVRIISETFRVLSARLDPSYTTATVSVLNVQRLQVSHGSKSSAPSIVREHVRLLLHRIGNSDRFVVWKVELLR